MGSFSLFMYMLGKIIGLQNYLNPSSWNCVILCDKDFYRYGYIKKVGMRDKLRCSRWTQYNHKALCKPETPNRNLQTASKC